MRLNIFKKKKTKKQKEQEKQSQFTEDETQGDEEFLKGFETKNVDKTTYNIVIYETLTGLPRKVMSFKAKRIIDKDDRIPYLYYFNKKTEKEWLEVFPQQIKDFIDYTDKEIDEMISKTNKKLKEERNKKNSTANLKDIEYQLVKLRAKKRSLKFKQNASYISLDDNNVPTIFFKRDGSNFIPWKWDDDNNTILLPSDNKKKGSSILLANKENKYPRKDQQMKISTYVMFAVACLLVIAGLFFAYKMYTMYDDNAINEAKKQCLQTAVDTTKAIKGQADSISSIINEMEGNIIVTGNVATKDNNRQVNLTGN